VCKDSSTREDNVDNYEGGVHIDDENELMDIKTSLAIVKEGEKDVMAIVEDIDGEKETLKVSSAVDQPTKVAEVKENMKKTLFYLTI